MILIAAVDENWGIGLKNDLLFHCPNDLHRFRHLTKGGTVVMGRKTWETLPTKPLPQRRNIVLSTKVEHQENEASLFLTLEEFLRDWKDRENVFVIGGGQIYHLLLPYVKEAYITKFFTDGHADVFIDNFEKDPSWVLDDISPNFQWNEISYQFQHFKRILQQ